MTTLLVQEAGPLFVIQKIEPHFRKKMMSYVNGKFVIPKVSRNGNVEKFKYTIHLSQRIHHIL